MRREEQLSVRQLSAAAFAGGWAPAAAAAGCGWQGAALAVPMVLLAGLGFISLWSGWGRLADTAAGKVLRAAYILWGGLLLSRGLSRAAQRIELTGGGGNGTALWLVLLLSVPLLWMARGRAGAFFRMAELCALAVLATVAVVMVWGAFRAEVSYLLLPAESVSGGFWAVVETGGIFLYVLPYINKTKPGERDGGRAAIWLGALAVGTAVLAAVTVGVLSPPVAGVVDEPLFLMTSALGKTSRVEGLISSLWLLSDLICLGILARCGQWGGAESHRLSVTVILLAAAAAVFKIFNGLGAVFWGAGTAVLGGATLLGLWWQGRNSG